MILRTLASALASGLLAATLAACSPPEAAAPALEPDARAESAPQISPDPVAVAPAKRRPERRPASADGAAATQYRYVDEHGKVLLAARLEDIPERQRSTATPLGAAARPHARIDSDEGRPIQNADVTIYSTRSCPYCRAAMAHFDKLGIYYVNRDVEADEEARAEYLELTGGRRGVPVIVVGDAWMQGWSQPEFERLLASSQ